LQGLAQLNDLAIMLLGLHLDLFLIFFDKVASGPHPVFLSPSWIEDKFGLLKLTVKFLSLILLFDKNLIAGKGVNF